MGKVNMINENQRFYNYFKDTLDFVNENLSLEWEVGTDCKLRAAYTGWSVARLNRLIKWIDTQAETITFDFEHNIIDEGIYKIDMATLQAMLLSIIDEGNSKYSLYHMKGYKVVAN